MLSGIVYVLFYTITTVFQSYQGSDMLYEMRRRKADPTVIPTHEILNLPHHMGVMKAELAIDDAVGYVHQRNGLQHSEMSGQ